MYIPMTIGGKKYTETSLWTNASPSSTFANQSVTLSESVDNFKYIAIKYKAYITSSETAQMICSVEDLHKMTGSSKNLRLAIAERDTNNIARTVQFDSVTSITFSTAIRLSNANSENNTCIPLEILGLNELSHGKTSDVIMQLGVSAESSSATTDITVSDLSNYTHVIFVTDRSATSTPLIMDSLLKNINAVVPVDYFKNNAIASTYNTNNSGQGVYNTVTFTYVNDTTVRVTRSNTAARYFSVFGIS